MQKFRIWSCLSDTNYLVYLFFVRHVPFARRKGLFLSGNIPRRRARQPPPFRKSSCGAQRKSSFVLLFPRLSRNAPRKDPSRKQHSRNSPSVRHRRAKTAPSPARASRLRQKPQCGTPMLWKGYTRKTTVPSMRSRFTGPKKRLSELTLRLSPKT